MLTRARALFEDLTATTTNDGPRRRDWVIVAFLVLILVAEVVGTEIWGDGELTVTLAVAGLGSLVVVPWRRIRPALALVPLLGEVLTSTSAEINGQLPVTTGALFFSTVLTVYAAARWLPVRSAAVVLGLIIVIEPIADVINGGAHWGDITGRTVGIGFLVALASTARYRASLLHQRIEEVRLLERQELARELHDVVAHHVSAIAVQAQAGQAVAAVNPEAAGDVLQTIEGAASEALAEMRRMVGILRSDETRQPHATIESFKALATTDSPSVTVATGDIADLPSAVIAAVYRIAQESITNARRHGQGVTTISIELALEGSSAILNVTNDGAVVSHTGSDGYGQIGMNERAEALDGHLESGPLPAGGWRVQATIPVSGAS